jgi:hypothetical protein
MSNTQIHIPHTIGTVDFAELHTANNQTRHDLPGSLDNSILGDIHVQAPHASQLFNLLHRNKTLDAERTKWAIVSRGGDDDGSIDGVWIHARLIVVMHRDKCPIRHDTGDAERPIVILAGDKIFDSGSVEELDFGEGEHSREEG